MNKKKTIRKAVAVLLTALMALPLFAIPALAERGGSFYLTVCTQEKTLLEPTAVSYNAGQSLKDALLGSGYEFGGLAESGYVYSFQGTSGNFLIFYDGGGYDLSVSASEITGLYITEKCEYCESLFRLVLRMGQYNEMTNNVQAYPPAREAYETALEALRAGTEDASAETILNSLNRAIKDYEAVLAGERYSVSFNVTNQDGSPADDYEIKMVDSYGNKTVSSDSVISVIANEYSFVVSGAFGRTEGSVTVGGACGISVMLPSVEWFGDIRILKDGSPLPCDRNPSALNGVWYAPDTIYRYTDLRWEIKPQRGIPDAEAAELYGTYTDTFGDEQSGRIVWQNEYQRIRFLLDDGMQGNHALLEARYTGGDGYTMIQPFELDFVRIPTLSDLTVCDSSGVNYLKGFEPELTDYSFIVPYGNVTVTGYPRGSEGYSVTVGGHENGCNLSVGADQDTIEVTVSHTNGQHTDYRLTVKGQTSAEVVFSVPDGTDMTVYTAAGSPVQPKHDGKYELLQGAEYSYKATKNTYYHTSAVFIASPGLHISVPEPDISDGLTDLAFYNASSPMIRIKYEPDSGFDGKDHAYSYEIPDTVGIIYAQASAADGSGYSIYAVNDSEWNKDIFGSNTVSTEIRSPVDPKWFGTALKDYIYPSGYSRIVNITLEKAENGVKYSQDYIISFARVEQIRSLTLTNDNDEITLYNAVSGKPVQFDRGIREYRIKLLRDVEAVTFKGYFSNAQGNRYGGGYSLRTGGRTYNPEEFRDGVTAALDPSKDKEVVEVTADHDDSLSVETTYSFTVEKINPVKVTFNTVPEDATAFITDKISGRPVYAEGGAYLLAPGAEYNYTVTHNGYVGKTGCYKAPAHDASVDMSLEAAPENGEIKPLDAEWPYFRADTDNNGIVGSKTPVNAEGAVLNWATKLGEGWSDGAVGCPIIVDGYLYVYAKTFLYKIDTVSGDIVAKGAMARGSNFAINTPTYADGMIFVGLSQGGVQAFNASTLESLWIYNDPIGAQPNCPIVYHDGYIYTGFWMGEDKNASYICLSVTDEDPANRMEEKPATWRYVYKGGFYWAGAYVCDDFMLVGTDDGETGYLKGHSKILSIDPKSGKPIDAVTLPHTGDQRSSITRDIETGDYYFTTKGGYFYRICVDSGGDIAEDKMRWVKLNNYASEANNPPMSTCSPCIYNGRAYVGVSGTGQFAQYSGHNITVIELNSMRIAYKVRTQGYPQTSGLLTTAYNAGDGRVYVYFFDNMTPGKLRILSDRPGQTAPEEVTPESFTSSGGTVTYDTASVLFTPVGEHEQYALCSPITDSSGTIYFKNDSGYLMALGSSIESLEVKKAPAKTKYGAGERFDPAGMEIVAHYANGTTRDVTKYVTYSGEPLTGDDMDFQIRFEHVLYRNSNGETGVKAPVPQVILELEISEATAVLGDVDEDGAVTAGDVSVLRNAVQSGNTDELNKAAADVNHDGAITAGDVSRLIRIVSESV